MTKFGTNKALVVIGRHAWILFTALKRMIMSTSVLGLFVISFMGFDLVSKEGGYAAVFDFILSCFLFAVAVAGMYLLGNSRKTRGGRYVEK